MAISTPPGVDVGEAMWTDETGRTWTSFGSLVVHDDLIQNTRQRFAQFLRGVYLESVNVYDYPPDTLYAPCVILNPSEPYIVPYDSGGPSNVLWGLEATFLVNRGHVDEGLIRLEFMWADFQDVIKGFPNTRWLSFGDVGSTTVADVEYLSATVTIGIVDKVLQPQP